MKVAFSPSLLLYSPGFYSKTVVSTRSALSKIQKRSHAGCGMPHDGDEVPGAGMERELRAHLNVTNLHIQDTSGNGSFYYVEIESPDFVGKSTVACHKLVQGIIANQIKNIHGLQLKTRAPKA
jgi:stress-induced morphogen